MSGQNRTFVVYVGSTVGATATAPVVFMFHGTSGTGDEFYEKSRWKQKSDEAGLITVFPDALTYCFHEDENDDGDFVDPGERKVTTKWTHGALGDPEKMPFCTAAELAALSAADRALVNHPFQEDVPFIDAIITFLKQNYVIDERRIYGTGFSNGAQFAARLAVERNNVFAALAAHAGGVSVPVNPGRPISFISSVGSMDDRFTSLAGGQEIPVSQSVLSGPRMKNYFVTPMIAQLKLADVYTYDQPTLGGGVDVARFTYRTSTAGASNTYIFAVIDNNTHAYPNGENHPIVMANVLWTFFEPLRLP